MAAGKVWPWPPGVGVRPVASTYNNLYLDTRQRLRRAGVEGAQLEARELVCAAAGKSREQFFRDMALYASDQVERRLEEFVQRRLAGEPVAYIIGEWEFYGLPLYVTPDVLIPRMDTEVLAEQTILLARQAGEGARVLDLCAGSGCVGLAVANNVPGCRVILADASEGALAVCKRNVRRCDCNARVTCVAADALAVPDPALWDFDVIACNPPYIPTGDLDGLDPEVGEHEPRLALDGGLDGLNFYRAVSTKWKNALRLGGSLLFEVGIGQAQAVEDILAEAGYQDLRAWQDTGGIWRVVGGTVPETEEG